MSLSKSSLVGATGMPGMPAGGASFADLVKNFLDSMGGTGGAGGAPGMGATPGQGGAPMTSSTASNPFTSGLPAGLMSPFGSLPGGGGSPGGQMVPFGSTNGSSTSKTDSPDPSQGTSDGNGESPTVQEFDSAAKALYGIPAQGDLKPLEDNGQPVTETSPSGMVGQAYVTPDKQVIVSFGGTGSGMGAELPGQLMADVIGGAGGVSQAQTDAAKFTQKVQGIADQQGLGSQNVYVTGHSLGGLEAQYASAQTGAGGMSFEAPGSTPGSNPKDDGSNFVNVIDQSDPIANIGQHYGKTLSVNTGQGLLAHLPGAQDNQLPLNEMLTQLESSLAG